MTTYSSAGNDHAAFKERLAFCIEKLGSGNALAKAAAIPQSTFYNYLRQGEPTRHNLIAIARTADVSLEWLASGLGAASGAEDKSIALGPEAEAAFQQRFDEIVTKRGGMAALAAITKIPIDRLVQVKAGGQLTRGELVRIGESANVSLHWLLIGRRGDAESPSPSLGASSKFVAGIEVETDRPQPRWAKGQGEEWLAETPFEAAERVQVMKAVFEKLPKGSITSFEVQDDTMKGDFEKGDLVIADGSLALTSPAVYLFEQLATKKRFLARAIFRDQGIICGYSNPFYDRNSQFEFSETTHRCLGRITHKMTST